MWEEELTFSLFGFEALVEQSYGDLDPRRLTRDRDEALERRAARRGLSRLVDLDLALRRLSHLVDLGTRFANDRA